MRKVIVNEFLTLDGTAQAPGGPEEDTSGELRLMISPVLVGGGKRIFPDDGALRPLRLVDQEATSTGTIIATYAPA